MAAHATQMPAPIKVRGFDIAQLMRQYIGMPSAGMTQDGRFQALPHSASGATQAQTVTQITPFDCQ
ncbi:hypothetical protein [Steroidobacter agaridevorans]|nr:hypothetical protein [Steroidobacter agaridevorans]